MLRPSASRMYTPTGKNRTLCQYRLSRGGVPDRRTASRASSTSALRPPGQPVPSAADWLDDGEPLQAGQPHARALPRRLAEQAARSEHQHEDEDGEGEDVLPLAPEARSRRSSRAGRAAGRPASAPRMLPMPPSTAAVNALMPGRKPMLNRAVSKKIAEQEARRPGQDAAEEEREHDDPVDVDAHERGRLGVLGGGADASTEPAARHEAVEGDHEDRWRPRRRAPCRCARLASPKLNTVRFSSTRWESDLSAAVAQGEELLEEERDADGGDERRQAGGVAPAQRSIGHPLHDQAAARRSGHADQQERAQGQQQAHPRSGCRRRPCRGW